MQGHCGANFSYITLSRVLEVQLESLAPRESKAPVEIQGISELLDNLVKKEAR